MIELKQITSPNCGACKMSKPLLEHIFKNIDKNVARLTILDIDAEESKELMRTESFRSLPGYYLFSDDKFIECFSGAINPVELTNKIKNLIK